VNVFNSDLCRTRRRPLPHAGRRGNPTSIFRGALLHIAGDDEIGFSDLYSGRTRIVVDTASGHPVGEPFLDQLRRVGDDGAAGGPMPSARLPVSFWRTLTRVTAAHRRLGNAAAVAKRLGITRREVIRRLAVARRLSQLGVKRRLGCSG
jgi:hypothetical protein